MIIAILSLLAGFLSVLAPCVLPLLPIIIGGSLSGDKSKYRPYVITLSLILSLSAFTLLLKVSTALIGIDPNVWSYLSGGIVIALGLTMLFPKFWETVSGRLRLQERSQKLLGKAGQKHNGLISAMLTGVALGPVFSSCSPLYGWVIATVLPESTIKGLIYLGFYSIGLGASLLMIALLGRKFIAKISWASNPHGMFQRIIAILFILVGLAVITGFDKQIQTYFVDKDFLNVKTLEDKLVPENKSSSKKATINNSESTDDILNTAAYPAAEITGIEAWINSDPLTIEGLKGKVVLIDFWTYSCINCVRTFPYLADWNMKYADEGLVIIGVHAPEFAFEKVPSNVSKAAKEHGLDYPIALDNDFKTWRAYENRYWPAHYLIDKDGNVRRTHFGEGQYAETEEAIQLLLKEAGSTDLGSISEDEAKTPSAKQQTPETYIGLARAKTFTNPQLQRGDGAYTLPDSQPLNTWSVSGKWTFDDEAGICISDCKLRINYQAKEVYGVFSADKNMQVIANGKAIDITKDDIYTLVENSQSTTEELILEFDPGLSMHAFTFGS